MESLPVHSCWVQVIAEPIVSHQVTQGVMATSPYRDLWTGSSWVGMVLWNLLAQEVQIPPKTVIDNVQMAEVVPSLKGSKPCRPSPLSEGAGRMIKGKPIWWLWIPWKKLIWPTPISPPSGLNVPTQGCDVLEQADLLGCAKIGPHRPTRSEKDFGRICRCHC